MQGQAYFSYFVVHAVYQLLASNCRDQVDSVKALICSNQSIVQLSSRTLAHDKAWKFVDKHEFSQTISSPTKTKGQIWTLQEKEMAIELQMDTSLAPP